MVSNSGLSAPEKKIKIAYVIDTIKEKKGGTEQQLLTLLTHIDRSSFESYLCIFKEPEWLNNQHFDWPLYYFSFTSVFSPAAYWHLLKFSRFLKKNQIDIVQTYFRDGNILGIIAARLAGIKYIISTRRNQGYWHNNLEMAVLKLLNRFVYRFAANSEAVRRYVCETEKVPAGRIDVIYNGIVPSDQSTGRKKSKAVCRRSFEIPPQSAVITIVANLRAVKGIDVLLKSMPMVSSAVKDILLLIVGDGELKNSLRELSEKLGISDRIRFMGFRNDVSDILKASDIAVLSSHSEGLSNSIIEYMAAGLPVVATGVGGNPELIDHGVNGYIVPDNAPLEMSDALIKLLNDGPLRRQMGAQSVQIVRRHFLLDKMVSRTEDYFRMIIASEK